MMRCAAIALVFVLAASARAQTKPSDLRTYETRYYVIHTDLGRDVAREADLRLTRMAEEYRRRTSEFSGDIPGKLPFYLFQREADYHAAGGTPNTAGEYNPNTRTLMAFAGDDGPNLQTWHAVQHEGFHQFADQVIGKGLPIWANEGLAEYFGEALFTGDGFVPGVVPQWRLSRIRKTLAANGFAPLAQVVSMSHAQWNQHISVTNYDHVWSLVHFLVHVDDGAMRGKLVTFLKETSGAIRPVEAAFNEHFGDTDALEARWREYWMSLPDEPTEDLLAESTLRTLTSFLARATARRQRFDSFDSFVQAAAKGELKTSESDWLPPSLVNVAIARARELEKRGARFVISPDPPRPPTVTYVDRAGSKMVGRFTLKGARVGNVIVVRAPGESP